VGQHWVWVWGKVLSHSRLYRIFQLPVFDRFSFYFPAIFFKKKARILIFLILASSF
jgi:hypothetical protein